jgi:hypothetical protein
MTPNPTDEIIETEMNEIIVTETKSRRKMASVIFVNSQTIIGSVPVVMTTDCQGYQGVVADQTELETDQNVVKRRMKKMFIVTGDSTVAGVVDEGLVHGVEEVVAVDEGLEGK